MGVDIRRTVIWNIGVLSYASQERHQRPSLVDGGVAEKMDEHQRPFPLSDVSEQLLTPAEHACVGTAILPAHLQPLGPPIADHSE